MAAEKNQTTIASSTESTTGSTFQSIDEPILRNDVTPAFVPKHTNATYSKPANDSRTAPRPSGFAYGLTFPYSLYMILRNDLKQAFVPKHTNATYFKPAIIQRLRALMDSHMDWVSMLSLKDPEKRSRSEASIGARGNS